MKLTSIEKEICDYFRKLVLGLRIEYLEHITVRKKLGKLEICTYIGLPSTFSRKSQIDGVGEKTKQQFKGVDILFHVQYLFGQEIKLTVELKKDFLFLLKDKNIVKWR